MALHDTIDGIITLYKKCGVNQKANWLFQIDQKLQKTRSLYEREKILNEIKSDMVGMGSLLDVYLIPKENSGLDSKEANEELGKLIHKLHKEIETELKGMK